MMVFGIFLFSMVVCWVAWLWAGAIERNGTGTAGIREEWDWFDDEDGNFN